jgi:hypothetical protein
VKAPDAPESVAVAAGEGHACAFCTPRTAPATAAALQITTGPTEHKSRNLEANPHVVLITGCTAGTRASTPWSRGKARRVTDHASLAHLGDACKAK